MMRKRWWHHIIPGILLGWTLAAALPAAARDSLHLSLGQAVGVALENNLGVRRARAEEQVREAAVAAAALRFGRSLGAGLSHQNQRSPSVSALEQVSTATSNAVNLSFGLTQQLSAGGRVSLVFNNSRASSNAAFRTVDPVYRSDLELRFSQPLLQGSGAVNQAGLELARNDLEGVNLALRGRTRDLEADVGLAYWDLFLARANLEVGRQLSAGARRVLETVRTRAEMGTGTRSSILEAEVGLARREADIVVAEGARRDAEDRLRTLCGLDQDPATWSLQLALTDTPAVVSFEADLESGIDTALTTSAAYQQAGLDLRNMDLQIALARDRTRPAVDLNARLGLAGIGGSYGDNLEILDDAQGRSWQGGLSLDIPLGQSADRARLQQRRLEKQRGEIDLENLRRQLVQQVRTQHRQVRISHRRTEVARAAVRLAARHVDEQEARLALGLSTVREVLDAQDDLASVRATFLQATVDYSKALIIWNRLTGE